MNGGLALFRRKHFLVATLVVLGLCAAQTAYANSSRFVTRAGLIFGPSHVTHQTAFKGFYDGHLDQYYNADVSSKQQAIALHVNFSVVLARSLPKATAPMYFVKGRAAMGQRAIFGSEPGEKDYSPLWQEDFVTWKSRAMPVVLTSDNEIFALQSKGELRLVRSMIVLNAPITKVGK